MSHLSRYEISFFIGPCAEWEAEDLVDKIMGLRRFYNVGGGGIGITRVDEDDKPASAGSTERKA